MNAYEILKLTEGLPTNERIRILYEAKIKEYDALIVHYEHCVKNNIIKIHMNDTNFKSDLRIARYNRTRLKNLLAKIDKSEKV